MKKPDQHIKYIKVVLPLALPKNYTFSVPDNLVDEVKFGIRVEVPLRNKLYAGLVVELMDPDHEPEYSTRNILSVLDSEPIITADQFELWQWMSDYYLCTLGEVMNVALPGGLKLSSETIVVMEEGIAWEHLDMSDDEYLVIEALEMQKELKIETIREILDKKTVYPVIKRLLDKRLVWTKELLLESYKEKIASYVKFTPEYSEGEIDWERAFELTARSEKQHRAILSLIQLQKKHKSVERKQLNEMADVDGTVLKALEKKGIVELFKKQISRIESYEGKVEKLDPVSVIQQQTIDEIEVGFKESHHALLHGVTGSGKTRIYQEFIKNTIESGGQVLYLLPEIGLTSQIVHRLNRVFGDEVMVFHSKLSGHKRVEIWNACYQGHPVIIGARSSLFLPFRNLKLIIVDEEHDSSFKQNSPNPRYNARDVAAFMASKYQAKVIMGSATPSLESFYNARMGKYTYIQLNQRFGEVSLPEIEIVNTSVKSNLIPNSFHYTVRLITQIQTVLNENEQVLLFQNRRGYSPTLICNACGWNSGCKNCDISMTYHKVFKELRCHYCSSRASVPTSCPQCGTVGLFDLGLGTEKVEDELKKLLPEANIARMDLDTAGTKNAIDQILLDFEQGKTDILIGTQMITKGLDFDRIGLVGILDADRLIQFPDFRSGERAFQLMLQVGGRAGRRQKQGKVIIQTSLVEHPILKDVLTNDFETFVMREMKERKQFNYPPFSRLIDIKLLHRDPKLVYRAAVYLGAELKQKLGKRVLGPAVPGIARIRGQYQQHILIKMEKSNDMVSKIKSFVLASKNKTLSEKAYSPVRIIVDVDPM